MGLPVTKLRELPDWPAMMPASVAGLYLGGLSADKVRQLGLRRVQVGRDVLYDRADLDLWRAKQRGEAGGDIDALLARFD